MLGTPAPKKELNNYERILLTIIENATFKIVSAIELYANKYSYNDAFFLCIIAEEELAKMIILPIARELGEMDQIINNNRKNAYYNHAIKQKIFTNFGLQNRTHEKIESIKQSCLYVGIDFEQKPHFIHIKPVDVFNEIKYTVLLFTNVYRVIFFEEEFSEFFKKSTEFFMKIIRSCVPDILPDLENEILVEADRLSKLNKKELKNYYHKSIVTNPYELIKIFKILFKDDYKKRLKEVGYFTLPELETYFKKTSKIWAMSPKIPPTPRQSPN